MKLPNGVDVKWFDRVANDEFYSTLDELHTDEDVEKFMRYLENGIKECKIEDTYPWKVE